MGFDEYNVSVRILFLTITLFIASPVVLAQAQEGLVSKDQAMKSVRVSSIPNWREAVSAEGKFRILFPAEPAVDDDVASVKGWKLVGGDSRWSALHTDLDVPPEVSDAQMRQAMLDRVHKTWEKGRFLSQKDVMLNGRAGSEFVITEADKLTYMRTFCLRNGLYMLSVVRTAKAGADAAIPGDVQQFFDSFTYWDRE
jgi:hypothetical protein